MVRKDRQIAPQPSLFPFLSILACLIGVLALSIGILAPAQAPLARDLIAGDRGGNLASLHERIEFAKTDLERLDDRRSQAQEIQTQREKSDADLQAALGQHQAQQDRAKGAVERKSQLKTEAESLERQARDLEPKLNKLEEQTKRLRSELAERQKPPPAPVTKIRGARRNIEAVFVECRPDGIAIHESDEPVVVPTAELRTNPAFLGLLERLANAETENGVVVFLVRSTAVATYLAARDVARENGCKNGKLPIVGDGPIDLSQVTRQVKEEAKE